MDFSYYVSFISFFQSEKAACALLDIYLRHGLLKNQKNLTKFSEKNISYTFRKEFKMHGKPDYLIGEASMYFSF